MASETPDVRAALLRLADQLDLEASWSARPGQMASLGSIAAQLRELVPPGSVVVSPERMREIAEALASLSKAAIVVKPTLNKPYPDAPETTPWRKFVEGPARVAYNLACELRRDLRQATPTREPGVPDGQ